MNVHHRLAEFFQALGQSADGARMRLYVDRLTETYAHGPNAGQRMYSDVTVIAAITHVERTWLRVSLPPPGVLIQACWEVRRQDIEHQKRNERVRDHREHRRMSPAEQEQCRLEAQLFDAGLDWCDVTGRWCAYGEAKHLDAEDEHRCTPQLSGIRAAIAAVEAGTLKGNAATVAFRRRSGISKVIASGTGIAVTKAQEECF